MKSFNDNIFELGFYFSAERIFNSIKLYKLSPNVITIVGGFIGVVGSVLLFFEFHLATYLSFILLYIYGVFDLLDGMVARELNKNSRFGAMLDTLFDKLVEALLLIVLIFRLPSEIAIFSSTFAIGFISCQFLMLLARSERDNIKNSQCDMNSKLSDSWSQGHQFSLFLFFINNISFGHSSLLFFVPFVVFTSSISVLFLGIFFIFLTIMLVCKDIFGMCWRR